VTPSTARTTNPGPSWGYRIISFCERALPVWLFNILLGIGTFVGLLCMPVQRRFAADYWMALTGHKPSMADQYRHFRSFMDGLVLKLQAGRGKYPSFGFAPGSDKTAFIELCAESSPALFGTFHVGYSDMMGCMLKDFDQRVAMVRHRVGNSRDTDILADSFAGFLRFLWINDPSAFIFDLKEAIQDGESIALQCDRTDFSSKKGCFDFIGKRREFPMTIYYLADLFKCPVVFSFTGTVGESGGIEVYTSRVFRPGPDRMENIKAGQRHFQEVLSQLEAHLRLHPELWFNFGPLNKECEAGGVAGA
jgi:predicted LPLAT superfamily acyltransferase